MNRSVLLTAALEDTEQLHLSLQDKPLSILHYPLERYQPVAADEEIIEALGKLEEYENIIHSNKRNAKFFVEKLKQYDKLETARKQLNFAMDQFTADYLEREGIAAVHPEAQGKAINLMEFMLRVRRIGQTLYPCGDKTKEALPGLLQELDMPVNQLVTFTLEGPREEKLQTYQKELASHDPGLIVFHTRRSVNRTLAAFPDVSYEDIQVIAGDHGVTDKLKGKEIGVDIQAEGSWQSILEKLLE